MSFQTVEYVNPWHRPEHPMYGPKNYTTCVSATLYKGYKIYHREVAVWDVVKDGVCITQMAGMGGAKRAIDKLLQKDLGGIDS